MVTYTSALVTGASSGIGQSLARCLAAQGTGVVVVARRGDRLERLAEELRGRSGASVEVLAADLCVPEDLATVTKRLTDPDRPIDLLVNNAGAGSRPPRPLADQPLDHELGKVELNVLAPLRLTHAALSVMIPRRHGGILNVSSIAGFLPQPQGATYAATKAFLTSMTETVHCEARKSGVHATVVCPGFVRRGEGGADGGMRSVRLPEFVWLDRDEVAREAIRAVCAGKPVCIPGWQYRTAITLSRVLPRVLSRRGFERLWGH
ncbi:SDR family NAD(P)-dependent oxidoreductase [Streptomyces roseoverticillatus]|uniref:SDR family NAD(P)-dependent oxidoreductase n=1 Tax=Streptomyces roseoverticillatus TaxID=66429 RepID=UPI0004C11C25|nr:SDR family oxidoreductase [Streptomyces roseoverticillatus]